MAWYNSNWQYRKKIIIDSTKVSADLVDFPTLISITDMELTKALSNGYDILFTDNNDVKLSHEIESFDNSIGKLVAWVKMPDLSSTTDTNIYLYYGNSNSSDNQNITDVWGNGFKGVWHLSSDLKDSTINSNQGTSVGTLTEVDGKIDKSQNLNESAYIDCGNNESLNINSTNSNGITLGGWIYLNSYGSWDGLLLNRCTTGNMSDGTVQYRVHDEQGKLAYRVNSSSTHTWNNSLEGSKWIHIKITHDFTTNTAIAYKDGINLGSLSVPAIQDYSGKSLYLGLRNYGSQIVDGYLDEVRVENVVRSWEWVQTEYNNQSNPNAFYTIGQEELNQPSNIDIEISSIISMSSCVMNNATILVPPILNLIENEGYVRVRW